MSRLLAIALFLGTMPLATAATIADRNAAPAFTLDICHPLAGANLSPVSCDLPPLQAFSFAHAVDRRGGAPEFHSAIAGRIPDGPDPPPPRSLA